MKKAVLVTLLFMGVLGSSAVCLAETSPISRPLKWCGTLERDAGTDDYYLKSSFDPETVAYKVTPEPALEEEFSELAGEPVCIMGTSSTGVGILAVSIEKQN